jgi:hypothetical protein
MQLMVFLKELYNRDRKRVCKVELASRRYTLMAQLNMAVLLLLVNHII